MNFSNRISQKLHDEHMATVVLMERLERLATSRTPPDVHDREVARLLSELASELSAEVWRHFDFEEEHLFSLLEEAGDSGIGAHLTEEHEIMRPLGELVIEQARHARTSGFDPEQWAEFRRVALDLSERLIAHVHKEESALVPALEDAMDSETEARLYEEYVVNR